MLSLVRHESSALPFTDGRPEYLKFKVNTDLLSPNSLYKICYSLQAPQISSHSAL